MADIVKKSYRLLEGVFTGDHGDVYRRGDILHLEPERAAQACVRLEAIEDAAPPEEAPPPPDESLPPGTQQNTLLGPESLTAEEAATASPGRGKKAVDPASVA